MGHARNRIVFATALLLFVGLFHSINTQGQFWKKSENKKHRKTKRNTENVLHETQQPWHINEGKRNKKSRHKDTEPTNNKKQKYTNSQSGGHAKNRSITYPLSIKKDNYRIDVLASLYLDELVKGKKLTFKNKIPEKAIAGFDFYEGVMIATDSLKNSGFNFDIYIHDVTSKSESIDSLIKRKKLDSSDLIIGAVSPQDMAAGAAFALKKHINFISALSPADGNVRSNKYFTVLQPTLKNHCRWIIENASKTFKDKKVIMMYRTSIQSENNAFQLISKSTAKTKSWTIFNCNVLPKLSELKKIFDSSKTQFIVMPILDIPYADSILLLLTKNFPKTHFKIIGMPTWTGLKLQHRSSLYPNITFIFPAPFQYNSENETSKYISKKSFKDFGENTPGEIVFRGFETLMWYGNLLKHYGTIFNGNYNDISASPFTHYNIQPIWDEKGKYLYNENTNIYPMHFEKE